MLRKRGLNHDLARPGGAAGAAGHLGDGLREPLGGAKVAREQALIGIQDHHQADIRENDGPW